MCFHSSQTKKAVQLEHRFDATMEYPELYEPYFHFNGWETKSLYIITQDDPYLIKPAYWGLMPSYMDISERSTQLKSWNTLNARSEAIFDSPLFREPALNNRCLILVDGFFEPHEFQGKKYPYYIRYKNKEAFAFAGIYNHMEDDIYTASILTTIANPYFEHIHNKKNKQGQYRMPLILDKKDEMEWINPDLREGDIQELTTTFTGEEFEDYAVSNDLFKRSVNSDRPSIIEPFHYPEMNTLF
ncbi:SOS response-associated peptidase [Kordia sp.]|uniref:SOS response-associated peptidase n=1 Tax=Kordia sp. TaxID=1965332 RepID=UPI0025BF2C64|nr:SOS response-associated peptidase [Kordia sp.]MCH2197003.1 SOS response-associated peptidase [Kordia sp.]